MCPRNMTILLLVVLGLFVLLPALGMSMGGFGMMGPGLWGGPGVGLVLLSVLAVAIVLLVQRRDIDLGRLFGDHSSKGPLDIVKERYARGEITREQYEQLRKDLEDPARS